MPPRPDPSPIELELDHVELYVPDLQVSARWFREQFAFTVAGSSGGSGHAGRSLALIQGRAVLVLTEGLAQEHPATSYVLAHGEGVARIALRTPDAPAAFAEAIRRGARPATGPLSIAGFGDVVNTFVQRGPADSGLLPPGFTPVPAPAAASGLTPEPAGLVEVDHFAVCVEAGELERTVDFYLRVLGFEHTFTEQITVGGQMMSSEVVQSASRSITLTIIEPGPGSEPGQIDEFLKGHGGAGVQHIAFGTLDAIRSVRALDGRGVRFLRTPAAYYDALTRRIVPRRHAVDQLRAVNLLVDEDRDGQLFQIFTRSEHPRRTLFFEVIERLGARTFGTSNIRALYEAVEQERARELDGQP